MGRENAFGGGDQGSRTPASSPKPPPPTPLFGSTGFQPVLHRQDACAPGESGWLGGPGGRAGTSGSRPSPRKNPPPRLLLTGPPQCGKTTVVRRVTKNFPGRVAGFFTREVRVAGRRVGFEIVTLDGKIAWLSHVDFPGPHRVGKYGVDLTGLHRVALPSMEPAPGIELIVVDEVGKMECLSPRFVAAMERLWVAPLPLLVTVAAKGGGLISRLKSKEGAQLITVTPQKRDSLPETILGKLTSPFPTTA